MTDSSDRDDAYDPTLDFPVDDFYDPADTLVDPEDTTPVEPVEPALAAVEDRPASEPIEPIEPSEPSGPADVASRSRSEKQVERDADEEAVLAESINSAMASAVAQVRAEGSLLPKWDEHDYVPGGNDGSGAWKLGDSAVAPLIVAARGYETVHEEDLGEAVKKHNLPRKNSAQGKRIAEAVTRGDILIMPWFTTEDLAVASRSAKEPVPTTIQFRPARPAQNEKTGKDMKYEFIGGQKTPIGIHPSFGRDWIDSAPTVLIAEGMLKGDAALTGYLLSCGVAAEALSFNGSGGITAARARLSGILDSIPLERRVAIMTIGGVDNWKNNSEWRDIELKGRSTWVGVDGDVSSNPNVYRACRELWEFLTEKKKTTPFLIAPTVQAEDGEKKVGIDDYLAKYGNWSGLTSMLSPRLPSAPPTNDLENIDKYRISPDGTALEICKPVCADPFNPETPTGGRWDEVLPLGGRILSTVAQRTPTPMEAKSGILGDGANNDDAEAYCEVEICWKSGDEIHKHVISGPANILNYTPDQWDRHKAHIPAAVLRNAEWPPPRKEGENWLRAMKGHAAEESKDRVRWDSMGWVPVEGTVPAFVVGDQVIGADDAPDIDIFAGIGEAELAGAARFGVGDETIGDFDDPAYRAQVRTDIEAVVETFILAGAWSDRRVASTVVAAALRPVLPIRPHSTLFCVGPPSKGKALPLDARVPVPVSTKFPTGWALNADLSVGDEVYAPDGSLTPIGFLSDVIDDMDMYEFTLADGQKITSTASHMWKVSTKGSRSTRDRNKHAAGRERRQAEANRLRGLAAQFANSDGITLKAFEETFGVTYTTAWSVTRRAGIPSETLWEAYGDPADPSHRKVRLFPVGETLLAVANHIETGKGTIAPVERVMTAAEVAAIPRAHAPAITLGAAIDNADADLPIPAYTLGAWLGDGTSTEGSFTCFDPEILVQIKEDGFDVTSWAAEGHGTITGLSPLLRAQGLLANKHIPATYLRASATQRLALLQGLMDTDGSVYGDQGQMEFTSVRKVLAEDVLELTRSLGIKATMSASAATITQTDPTTGEKTRRDVGERYRVRFTTAQPVFRLTCKAMRVRTDISSETTRLGILDVQRLAPVPSRCIQVEHETGMFLADGFVPTHNSWTAAMMMGFWSRRPGSFTSSSLPGSAKDTAASIETAVARVPIWVIDDLAPASSRQQSENEQNKIGDVIRNVFNGAGKRRSTADMGSRKVHAPRALLVVTAENEPQVASVRDRCITLDIGWGALAKSSDPTNKVQTLCEEDGAPARVTQAMIRFLRHEAKRMPGDWADLYAFAESSLVTAQDNAASRMKKRGAKPGDLKRHADLAGDIAVSLLHLRNLAEHVGVREEILDLLSNSGMIGDVYDLVAQGHKSTKESTPGRALMEALQSALFRKKAHLLDATDPGAAPGGPNISPMLGWEVSGDGSRPKGDTIGFLVTDEDGSQYAFLEQKAAFSIAQREYPNLVPPGQGPRSSWGSVIGEGLHAEHLLRKRGDGTKLNTGRKRVGDIDISGVPIPLDTLLLGGAAKEEAERQDRDDQ